MLIIVKKAGCFPDVWKEWKKAVLVYIGPQFSLQSTLPRTSGKTVRDSWISQMQQQMTLVFKGF